MENPPEPCTISLRPDSNCHRTVRTDGIVTVSNWCGAVDERFGWTAPDEFQFTRCGDKKERRVGGDMPRHPRELRDHFFIMELFPNKNPFIANRSTSVILFVTLHQILYLYICFNIRVQSHPKKSN